MSSLPPRDPTARPHGTRLLIFVLSSLFLANVVQWALCRALRLGNPGGLKQPLLSFLHLTQWTDSWLPMMKSLDYFGAHPTEPIYFAHLYDTLIYSLASLLPLLALRKLGLHDPALLRLLAITSWIAVLGVGAVSLLTARWLLRRRSVSLDWQSILAVSLACVFCYPLLKGYALGNAQTFLSLLFAVLLFLWTSGRERSSGVVAALLAFVKPQYGILLLWMTVRRRWGATLAFLACSAVLLALSTAVFGWHNNLDYLQVLSSLSRKAQSHYGNQSMFGTLNRIIGNGENLSYTPHLYTPYIAWVYRATLLTGVLIMGTALLFPWGKLRASTADLAAMGLASVASSPMAWEHHYGIVFPIAAWVWFAFGCWQRKRPWLLALATFLTLNALTATNFLAPFHGWNVLQSYLYFGALLMLFVLMRLARNVTDGYAEPVP
ncbi:MAG TPA: glycosyltransferase family 87 protein [Acidobacteriaceae bacterium]|jgi:hypothetical protein|nr:glycosyltransferase family 87 protein [Acidobacteriaceae bacterium]